MCNIAYLTNIIQKLEELFSFLRIFLVLNTIVDTGQPLAFSAPLLVPLSFSLLLTCQHFINWVYTQHNDFSHTQEGEG